MEYGGDPELRRDFSQEIHLALWRSLAKFTGGVRIEPGSSALRISWRRRMSSAQPGATAYEPF